MIKPMHKLTVKKLNYLASLSEETYCFSAYVYVDNKVIGKASNLGQGGSTDFHPNEDGQAYLTNIVGRSKLIELIDDAVHAAITEKTKAKELRSLKKHMLKAVCFIKDKSQEMHHYNFCSLRGKPILVEANYNALVEGVKRKYPEAIILNGKTDAELVQLLAI